MNYITLNDVFCEKIIQIGPIGKKCQIRFSAIYSGAEGVKRNNEEIILNVFLH